MTPESYQRHDLHSLERIWPEKNCYIDIWIELVHSLRLDPMAMMAFTVAIDFEGDQWTFFKPPHEDLKQLYGIDVQELYVWRPLLEHAVEHADVLEYVARLAFRTVLICSAHTDDAVSGIEIPAYVSEHHYLRKHGPKATYGQR